MISSFYVKLLKDRETDRQMQSRTSARAIMHHCEHVIKEQSEQRRAGKKILKKVMWKTSFR